MAGVGVAGRLGLVELLAKCHHSSVKDSVELKVEVLGPAVVIAQLDGVLVTSADRHRGSVLCGVSRQGMRGRRGTDASRRHWSAASGTATSRCHWSRCARQSLGEAAAVDGASGALRRVRDVGDSSLSGRLPLLLLLQLLLLLATLTTTALALAASALRLALRVLEEQLPQELGHSASTSVATTSVAPASAAALRLGLLRSSAIAAISASRIAWHTGRRPVVGVEECHVLGEPDAGSRFRAPRAFVAMPRRFRGGWNPGAPGRRCPGAPGRRSANRGRLRMQVRKEAKELTLLV